MTYNLDECYRKTEAKGFLPYVLPEKSVLTVTGRGLAFLKIMDRAFKEQVDGLTIRPPNPRSPLRRYEVTVNELWLVFQERAILASPMSTIVEQYTQDLLPVREKLSHVLAALPAARADVDF